MNLQFSVITSVYKNDKPEFIRVALDSMLKEQTVKPDEIVLVQDGPVPYETSRLLIEYLDKYGEKINIIKLESRPIQNKDFEFMFYFDLNTSIYSEQYAQIINELDELCEEYKYLGSYLEIV